MPSKTINEAASDDLGGRISLWSIALESRRIPWSPWTLPVVLSVWVLVSVTFYFGFGTVAEILSLARDLTRLAVNSTIALLGFFLSGFAIFATLGDRALLMEMAKARHAVSGLSYFKYNLYVLLRPLMALTVLAIILVIAVISLGPGTGLGRKLITLHCETLIRILASLAVGLSGASLMFLVMSAGSFVANVYISVATTTRWELLKREHRDHDGRG